MQIRSVWRGLNGFEKLAEWIPVTILRADSAAGLIWKTRAPDRRVLRQE